MGFLTAPSTLLSLVLATALAGLFHLWQGEKPRDMLLYWPVAVVGFLLGQLGANALGLNFLMVGEVHLLEGLLASGLAMSIAKWLKL